MEAKSRLSVERGPYGSDTRMNAGGRGSVGWSLTSITMPDFDFLSEPCRGSWSLSTLLSLYNDHRT